MGTYVYRITAKKRKMTTGEEVRLLKYLYKPSWNYGYREPTLQDNGTEECLAVYDYEQASEVFRFKAGSSLWYDSDEGRREVVGYLLRDGKNRMKMVWGKLDRYEEDAYALVEMKGNDENRHFSISGRYMKSWWKASNGTYWFQLIEGTSSDGPVAYSNCFVPGGRTSYEDSVETVADCLRKLFEKEVELEGLREAG